MCLFAYFPGIFFIASIFNIGIILCNGIELGFDRTIYSKEIKIK